MKKLILITLIVATVSFGQQYRKSAMESWYNDVVKARISAIVADSLGSTIAASGKSIFDSVAIGGEVRIGGLANYNAQLVVKNTSNSNDNLLDLVNKDGNSRAKVDSAGRVTSVGLTTTGSITATGQTIGSGAITSSGKSTFDSLLVNGQSYFGAAVNWLAKVSVKNSLFTYAQQWFNSTGGQIASVDSSGGLNATAVSTLKGVKVGTYALGGNMATIDSIALFGTDSVGFYIGGTLYTFFKSE